MKIETTIHLGSVEHEARRALARVVMGVALGLVAASHLACDDDGSTGVSEAAVKPICGDGVCKGRESCTTCPSDCGTCGPSCGDAVCAGNETCASCPTDCGACAACGDGTCNAAETCASCPGDCGACDPTGPSGYHFYDEFDAIPGPWTTEPAYSSATAFQYAQIDNSSGGKALALVVTPTSNGPNASSEMAAVWLQPETAHAGWAGGATVLGQDTWYRVRMRFPSGGYYPTTGQWNWHVEWHDDAHTASSGSGPYSMATGVYTDYPAVSGAVGQNPRLAFRLAGGSQTAPTYEAHELPPNSLLYDHWYELLYHFVWHTSASIGLVEWWVDGQLVVSKNFPTLYTNGDGTHSYNTFGLYNYRWHDPTHTSRVEYDFAVIGPTLASVGQ